MSVLNILSPRCSARIPGELRVGIWDVGTKLRREVEVGVVDMGAPQCSDGRRCHGQGGAHPRQMRKGRREAVKHVLWAATMSKVAQRRRS